MDTANNQASLRDCNFERNYCGIAIAQGGGIRIDTAMLESCTIGIYVNPDNGDTIRDLQIINPYFEGTTNSIVVGADTLWTRDGDIYYMQLTGGYWDSSGYPTFANVNDLWINCYEQHVRQMTFGATVWWSMPQPNHYSTRNVTEENATLAITEFYIRANNASGHNPMTITLVPIAQAPVGIPIIVKRIDANAQVVTVDANAAETIDDIASVNLYGKDSFINVIKDSVTTSQWRIIGGGIYGQDTWDPGAIADGDEEAKEVTVTGAALGDFAIASFSLDVSDLVLNAQVTAANTVTCILANNTGGAINLGSGTIMVRVTK